MAVYKVIQDIEAEDRLLGPLTLKGLIYALIAGALAFINFRLLFATSLGPARWFVILLFLLPMALFGVLASPLGREQPTEVWLLSHVRFLIKPRKRMWNQSGISQLVTITAPKRIERVLTKGFSQSEVSSRLQALATTLDSRGWAVKNVNVNLNTAPQYLQKAEVDSDRLIAASSLPQTVPVVDIHPADDILDEQNNPTAQKFDQLMKRADVERKKGILDRVKHLVDHGDEKKKQPHKKLWTIDQDTQKIILNRMRQAAEKNKDDPELEARLKRAEQAFASQQVHKGREPQASSVTATNQAANMELAQSGSDFKVSTLEKLANRQPSVRQIGPNEVELSLH